MLNEQDSTSQSSYDKMNNNEFLEFIARLSEIWFQESEMEVIPLHRKIEYFLEIMLATVGMKIKR